MESPSKRQRLSRNDEPEFLRPSRDHRSARRNLQQKFKSKLESIFERYSQDFTDIGDEIDIASGEVVVDNGHLLSMENETDLYGEEDAESDESHEGPANSSEDELEVEHELQDTSAPLAGPGADPEDSGAINGDTNDSDLDNLFEERIADPLDSCHLNGTFNDGQRDDTSIFPPPSSIVRFFGLTIG